MKRTEKLKLLQDTLQGHTAQLHQLKRQLSKKQMPYLEATGFVDMRHCSPLLMDMDVVYNESLLSGASYSI